MSQNSVKLVLDTRMFEATYKSNKSGMSCKAAGTTFNLL